MEDTIERRNALFKAYHERQGEIDARVREGIETYRKGDATLHITDREGRPLAAEVSLTLKKHAFRFGCNCFMLDEMESEEKNQNYKEKFAALFNLATMPFYWKDLEPQPGKPRYAADSEKIYRRPASDLCLNYCRENGIEPKVHCLNYMQWAPTWLPDDIGETKRLLEKRMRELSERYRDAVPCWEVTNETFCSAVEQPFYREPDFVEWSFETARRYFPHNELTINDFAWYGDPISNRLPYYMQIERALAHGTPIDSVGFQFHLFDRRENLIAATRQRLDPLYLFRMHDQYAKLGLPMQITEITIPSYANSQGDEELQAEMLSLLYRVWFSMEKMEKIIYWNLQDGYAAFAPQGDMEAGENYYGGGLLRFDGSKKPVYHCLDRLLHEEWHTAVQGATQNGDLSFRGFYGEYEARVTVGGRTVTLPFVLKKGEDNQITLTL